MGDIFVAAMDFLALDVEEMCILFSWSLALNRTRFIGDSMMSDNEDMRSIALPSCLDVVAFALSDGIVWL